MKKTESKDKAKKLPTGVYMRKDEAHQNKPYYARFQSKQTGKRLTSPYFATADEAAIWRDRAKAKEVLEIEQDAPARMKVDRLAERWLASKPRRKETYNVYETRYRLDIKPVIGHKLIKSVTPQDCREIMRRIENKSSSAITQTNTVLTGMFALAVEDKLLKESPVKASLGEYSAQKAKEEAISREPKHALTKDEQTKFRQQLCSRDCSNRDAFLVALNAGLRAGEICGLHWEDVDFERRLIRVRYNYQYAAKEGWYDSGLKTPRARRDVPMSDECYEILQQHKRRESADDKLFKGLVFLTHSGRPVERSTYNKSLKSICKQAGITRISMHDLRRTFATNCAAAGVAPEVLMAWMGHESINITYKYYVCVADDRNASDIAKLNGYMKLHKTA